MVIQLISFKALCKLIREQQDMPDVYRLTSMGRTGVQMTRDNCYGLESALQGFGSSCGISIPRLNRMDALLGWLFITQTRSSHEPLT